MTTRAVEYGGCMRLSWRTRTRIKKFSKALPKVLPYLASLLVSGLVAMVGWQLVLLAAIYSSIATPGIIYMIELERLPNYTKHQLF